MCPHGTNGSGNRLWDRRPLRAEKFTLTKKLPRSKGSTFHSGQTLRMQSWTILHRPDA